MRIGCLGYEDFSLERGVNGILLKPVSVNRRRQRFGKPGPRRAINQSTPCRAVNDSPACNSWLPRPPLLDQIRFRLCGRGCEQAEEDRFDSFIAGLIDEYRPLHPAFPRPSAGLAMHAWD